MSQKFQGTSTVALFMSCALGVACTGQLGAFGNSDGEDQGSDGANGNGAVLVENDDPGFKGIHRLNSREYDNTIRDLLGTRLRPGVGFLSETGHGFDNVAVSLGMTPAQYSAYFRAAEEVAADVFTSPELTAPILSCDSGTPDESCAETIIRSFGLRAFRRPLEEPEVTTYLKVYQRAVALDLNHRQATQQVVRAFLSSAEFLYRMEFDKDPTSAEPHPVSEYELASRLSYFLFSTTPSPELLSRAEEGSITENLDEVVDGMLAERRADELVDGFAWQWLGYKALASHAVLSDVVPEWSEEIRTLMLEEGRSYLYGFLREERPWSSFLTADVEARAPELEALYGGPAGGRYGFLGLGGFLTVSSFAHRTSPTFRAKWILEELLCDPPDPPPPTAEIPDLDAEDLANQAAEIENVRARLELHRSDPGCAGCHAAMDPLGMALEHFDVIGRYRAVYENGDEIDPTGELPGGAAFDGLPSLADALAEDRRFFSCSVEKAFIYGLGRGLVETDAWHLAQIEKAWQAKEGATFAELIKSLIKSTPFLERRGGSK